MSTSSGVAEGARNELAGIGGWLLLPIIIVIWSVVDGVITLFDEDASIVFLGPRIWHSFVTPNTILYQSTWVPVVFLGMLIQLVGLFLLLIALPLIFKKKKIVPGVMIAIFTLGLCHVAVDGATTFFLLPHISSNLAEQAAPGYFKELVTGIMNAAIWIPYFMKSRRVKNTFVN